MSLFDLFNESKARGYTVIKRKKDGANYATTKEVFTHTADTGTRPSWRLEPRWSGRTHYKSIEAVKREFVNLDGSPITE